MEINKFVKLTDNLEIRYVGSVVISGTNVYKYEALIGDATNRKTSAFFSETLIDVKNVDKVALANYVEKKLSENPNEESVFIDLSKFDTNNEENAFVGAGAVAGGNEEKVSAGSNGEGFSLASYDKFDEAIKGIRELNCPGFDLKQLSRDCVNLPKTYSDEYDSDTYAIETQMNKYFGDKEIGEFVSDFKTGYEEIFTSVAEAVIADIKLKAENGELQLPTDSILAGYSAEDFNSDVIDMCNGMLTEDGTVTITSLSQITGGLNDVRGKYFYSSKAINMDIIKASSLTIDDLKDMDMTDAEKAQYIESAKASADSLFGVMNEAVGISREDFDALLMSNPEKLAAQMEQISMNEAKNYGTDKGDSNGYNELFYGLISDYYSTEVGQRSLLDKFIAESGSEYDEFDAVGKTNYIQYCVSLNHGQDWLLEELKPYATILDRINWDDNFCKFEVIEDPEILQNIEAWQSNLSDLNGDPSEKTLPYGVVYINGEYRQRVYTTQGQDMLYYMDYHMGENIGNTGANQIVTAFSNQGIVDATERDYKGRWVATHTGNYLSSTSDRDKARQDAERDYYILNGVIEDEERYNELVEAGEVSFTDVYMYTQMSGNNVTDIFSEEYLTKNENNIGIFAAGVRDERKKQEAELFNFHVDKAVDAGDGLVVDTIELYTNAWATLVSSVSIAGMELGVGVAKHIEGWFDAGKMALNSDVIQRLKIDAYSDGNITLDFRDLREANQEFDLFKEEVWNDYYSSELYKTQFDEFLKNGGAEASIKAYYDKYLYDPMTGMYKAPNGKTYYSYEDIPIDTLPLNAREQLISECFKESKMVEWSLNDASSSNYYLAAYKDAIRNGGDFTRVDKLSDETKRIAAEQFDTMNDVSIDAVNKWAGENIFDTEWFQDMEDISIVKHGNIVGVVSNQIGNMAIPVLASIIPGVGPALSSALLFTSAFGGAAEEAINSGGSYNEALKYATLSAATEVVIEKVFSGVAGIGEGWFDDVLSAGANKLIGTTDDVIKTLGGNENFLKDSVIAQISKKMILNGIGEGAEEVVTDLVTPLWQSLTFLNEKSYIEIVSENVSLESLGQTFLVSFLTSMVFGSGGVIKQSNNFKSQVNDIIQNYGDIPGLKEHSNAILAEIIGYDAYVNGISKSEIINEIINRHASELASNPESKAALQGIQNDMIIFNNNLANSSVTMVVGNQSIQIPKSVLFNITDVLGVAGGYKIQNGVLSFNDGKVQDGFINAIYSQAQEQLQMEGSMNALIQGTLGMKFNDLSFAIETISNSLTSVGDSPNVIIEVDGNEISIPQKVVEQIISNPNIDENGRLVFDEDLTVNDFIDGIKEQAKLITQYGISSNLYGDMTQGNSFNEQYQNASQKVDQTATDIKALREDLENKKYTHIDKAIETVKNVTKNNIGIISSKVLVTDSAKVNNQDLVKLEVQTVVDGKQKQVNVYVDSASQDIAFNTNGTVANKIYEIIEQNKDSENVYVGEITYDEKQDNVVVTQNDTNKAFVYYLNTGVISSAAVTAPAGQTSTTTSARTNNSPKTQVEKNNDTKQQENATTNKSLFNVTNINTLFNSLTRNMESFIQKMKTDYQRIVGTKNISKTALDKYKLEQQQKFNDRINDCLEKINEMKNSSLDAIDSLISKLSDGDSLKADYIEQRRKFLDLIQEKTSDFMKVVRISYQKVISSIPTLQSQLIIEGIKDIETASTANEVVSNNNQTAEEALFEILEKLEPNSRLYDSMVCLNEGNTKFNKDEFYKFLATYRSRNKTNFKSYRNKLLKNKLNELVESKKLLEEMYGKGFLHFRSSSNFKINGDTLKIYLSVDNSNIHAFSRVLLEEFIQIGQKDFYFKINNVETQNRRDNFVLYCDKTNIAKFTEIIEKVIQRNPNIKFNSPNLLGIKYSENIYFGHDQLGVSHTQQVCREIERQRYEGRSNREIVENFDEIKMKNIPQELKSLLESKTPTHSHPIYVNPGLKNQQRNKHFGYQNGSNVKINDINAVLKVLPKTISDVDTRIVLDMLTNPTALKRLRKMERIDTHDLKNICAMKTIIEMRSSLGIKLDNNVIRTVNSLYNSNIHKIVKNSIEGKLSQGYKDFISIYTKYDSVLYTTKRLEAMGYSTTDIAEAILSFAVRTANYNISRKAYDYSYDYLIKKGYSRIDAANEVRAIYHKLIDLRGFDTIVTKEGLKIHIQKGFNWNNQAFTLDYIESEISKLKSLYKGDIPLNIYLHDTFNADDKYWEVEYEKENFKSIGCGGYSNGVGNIRIFQCQKIYLSTVAHEFGHIIDERIQFDLGTDVRFAYMPEWLEAIELDNNSVSKYGDTNSVEDFAESLAYAFRKPKEFKDKYQNRYKVLSKYIDLNQSLETNVDPFLDDLTQSAIDIMIQNFGINEALRRVKEYANTGNANLITENYGARAIVGGLDKKYLLKYINLKYGNSNGVIDFYRPNPDLQLQPFIDVSDVVVDAKTARPQVAEAVIQEFEEQNIVTDEGDIFKGETVVVNENVTQTEQENVMFTEENNVPSEVQQNLEVFDIYEVGADTILQEDKYNERNNQGTQMDAFEVQNAVTPRDLKFAIDTLIMMYGENNAANIIYNYLNTSNPAVLTSTNGVRDILTMVDKQTLVDFINNNYANKKTVGKKVYSKLYYSYYNERVSSGRFGPSQSAIGAKLDDLNLRESFEALFNDRGSADLFYANLAKGKFSAEEFNEALRERYRRNNDIFEDALIKQDLGEIANLTKLVMKNIPELNASQAFYFLHFMEFNEIGSNGICSYADVASIILNEYAEKPYEFELDFGYPLYTINPLTGKRETNYNMLMVDLYSIINKESLIRKNLLGESELESSNSLQVYMSSHKMGINEEALKKFFEVKSKEMGRNVEIKLTKTFRFDTKKDNTSLDDIIAHIQSNLEKDNYIHLGACGFELEYENGRIYNSNIGGHAMTVLGIDDKGRLIVNSWSHPLYFDIKKHISMAESKYYRTNSSGEKKEYIRGFTIDAYKPEKSNGINIKENNTNGIIGKKIDQGIRSKPREVFTYNQKLNKEMDVDIENVEVSVSQRNLTEKFMGKPENVDKEIDLSQNISIEIAINKEINELIEYLERNLNKELQGDLEFKSMVKSIYKKMVDSNYASLMDLHGLLSKKIGKKNSAKLMYEIGTEILVKPIGVETDCLNKDVLKQYYIDMFENIKNKEIKQFESALTNITGTSLKDICKKYSKVLKQFDQNYNEVKVTNMINTIIDSLGYERKYDDLTENEKNEVNKKLYELLENEFIFGDKATINRKYSNVINLLDSEWFLSKLEKNDISISSDFKLSEIQRKELETVVKRLAMYKTILNENIGIDKLNLVFRNSETPSRFYEEYNRDYSISYNDKTGEWTVELWNSNVSEENIISAFADIILNRLIEMDGSFGTLYSNTEGLTFGEAWVNAINNNNKVSSYDNLISIRHDFIRSFVLFNQNPHAYLGLFGKNKSKGAIIRSIFNSRDIDQKIDKEKKKILNAILSQEGIDISNKWFEITKTSLKNVEKQFRGGLHKIRYQTNETPNNYNYAEHHFIFGGETLSINDWIHGTHTIIKFMESVRKNRINLEYGFVLHPSFIAEVLEFAKLENPRTSKKTVFVGDYIKLLKEYYQALNTYQSFVNSNDGESQLILLTNGLWMQRHGKIDTVDGKYIIGESCGYQPIIYSPVTEHSNFIKANKINLKIPVKIQGNIKTINVTMNPSISPNGKEYIPEEIFTQGPKLIKTVRRLINNSNVRSINISELRFNPTTETFDVVINKDGVEVIIPSTVIADNEINQYILEYIEAIKNGEISVKSNSTITKDSILEYKNDHEYFSPQEIEVNDTRNQEEMEVFGLPNEVDNIEMSPSNKERDDAIEDLEPLMIYEPKPVNGSNESSQTVPLESLMQLDNFKQLSVMDNIKHTLVRINEKFTGFKASKLNALSDYERVTKTNNELLKQKAINKTFRDFANKHLIDIKSLKENGLLKNPKISEINSLISNNRILTDVESANVSIADIIGTKRNVDLDRNFNLLFNEGTSEFQIRDLELLKYPSDQVLNVLSRSFETHPLVISEVDTGKYIIEENGYHRYSLLRLHYLNEYMKVKDNPKLIEELNKKYTIPVKVYKLDYTKTYCTSILKELGLDVKVKTSPVTKSSIIFIDGKKTTMSDTELIEFVKKEIVGNVNSKEIIDNLISKSDSFRKFYDEHLKTDDMDYEIEFNEDNSVVDNSNKNIENETNPNTIESEYKFPETFNGIKLKSIVRILEQPNSIQRYSIEKRMQFISAIKEYVEYFISNKYDMPNNEYKGYLKISELMGRDIPDVKLGREVKSTLLTEFRKNVINESTFGSKQGIIRTILQENGVTDAINYLFNKNTTGTKFLEEIKDITDEEFQDLLDSVVSETGKLEGLYNLYRHIDLFNVIANNIEGIEDFEIIKFLYLFESYEAGGKGICNYSAAVNMIFNKYLGKEKQFKLDFGYPMYITVNGKKVLNDTILLADMYSAINKDVFVSQVDGKTKVVVTSNKDYLPVTIVGGSFNMGNLQKFLDMKSKQAGRKIELNLRETFKFNSTNDMMWKEEILVNVRKSLRNGETINLSAAGFDLHYTDGKTIYAKNLDGHVMTVVGITKDGNLIVDSYGKELVVNLDEVLENTGKPFKNKNGKVGTRRFGITSYSFDNSNSSTNQTTNQSNNNIVNDTQDEGLFDVFKKPTEVLQFFKDTLLEGDITSLSDSEISTLVDYIKKGKIKLKEYNLSNETISILIDKVPLQKIYPLSNVKAVKTFIEYFGKDILVEFDKLNNNFLLGNNGENLYSLFDYYDLSIPKTNNKDKLHELTNLITNAINGNKKSEYKTYSFDYSRLVGCEYAKTHPELFLDDSAPQDLKDAFYNGRVNSGNEYNPKWSKYLEGKSIKGVVHEPLLNHENIKTVENINLLAENSSKYEQDLLDLANRVGLTRTEVQEILSPKMRNLIENSEFGVRGTIASLQKVLESGKIKNQFEVSNSSYGVYNPDMRMDMEKEIFGIPRNIRYEDRPIYGMLLPKEMSSKYVTKGPGAYYSEGSGVIYIFDKSKIKENATLTLGDSLDQAGKVCATNLLNPKYFGMFSEMLTNIRTRQDLENFDFTSLYEKSVMEVGNSAYYEFQLHGESSHTLDNLQEIVFLKKPEAQIIEKLKELNISWRVIK